MLRVPPGPATAPQGCPQQELLPQGWVTGFVRKSLGTNSAPSGAGRQQTRADLGHLHLRGTAGAGLELPLPSPAPFLLPPVKSRKIHSVKKYTVLRVQQDFIVGITIKHL